MANFKIRNRTDNSKSLLRRIAGRYFRDRRGNIAAIVAIMIVPMVGILGVATESSSWFFTHRAAQNAADSAVLAAATNGGNGQTDYVTEATQVATKFGFTSSNSTVTVPAPTTYATVTPCSTSACYKVSITKQLPINLVRLLGYRGTGGSGQQTITAVALASTQPVQVPFCLLAIGTGTGGNAAISSMGSPNANLPCNVMSDGDSSCSGHSITTGYSDTAGTNVSNKPCGPSNKLNNGVASVSDPYAGLASHIPANTCSSYYPETNASWPSSNTLSVSTTLPATTIYCGDVKLGGNVTITSAAPGSLIVIENGQLDLNGYSLTSASGSGVTIIFTSPQGSAEAYTSGGVPTNFICNNAACKNGSSGAGPNGVLDIAAPTSGTWSGIAVFQDPSATTGLPLQGSAQCTGNNQWGYSGNKPTLNITGVVDISRTQFCASGDINQSTNGYACMIIVTDTLTVNGTANLFYQNSQSQCQQAGVTQITNKGYVIGRLVY